MRWVMCLVAVSATAVSIPASAQLSPGGPSGDFRVDGRSGTAPTVGAPGGPSLPPTPMLFRDSIGPKPSDEILKGIDKDLGRPTLDRPSMDSRPFDLDKDLRRPSDSFK